jgi:hypothetical protein
VGYPFDRRDAPFGGPISTNPITLYQSGHQRPIEAFPKFRQSMYTYVFIHNPLDAVDGGDVGMIERV